MLNLIANWFIRYFLVNVLITISCDATAIQHVYQQGDILLGGLFPVHEAGRTVDVCGSLKSEQGVQRLQAMLYALDLINEDNDILPELRIGAQIFDTCSVDSYALEQTLAFIKSAISSGREFTCEDGSEARYKHQPVAAVIGAASSQVSVMVASVLQLFKLGWTYVHAVAVSGSYGEKGIESFRVAANRIGICIDGHIHRIDRRWDDEQFSKLIWRMKYKGRARGVVLFVNEDNLRRMLSNLETMTQTDASLKHYFWWVGSDSWGRKLSVINDFPNLTEGAITIAPNSKTLPGFEHYFMKLKPTNTFLLEYWKSLNCTRELHMSFGECFEEMGINFKQEAYVPSVVDAVNVIAHALHKYLKDYCGDIDYYSCNVSRFGFDGMILQQYYRNKAIIPNILPLIDSNGDGFGIYGIYQLKHSEYYVEVGKWSALDGLELDVERVRKGLMNWDGELPLSVCSVECERSQYRSYQDQNCCWACIPCDITTSIIMNETSCVECQIGMVPNEELDACRMIIPTELKFDSPWFILPATFSALGIFATIFVTSVFIRYNSTPIVKASGRELCYCMLTGVFLCYLVTFFMVSKPNVALCTASRILIGFSMSVIYAAILTKTNRLARVFSPISALQPRWIQPKAQVAICGAILSIQLIGSIIWLEVDSPNPVLRYPTRTEAILTCNATASHLFISLLYNIILIIACTLYAFKTRKIPENFNETRLIGFTMYSTSILWLSFGPIYFATQNNFKIQVTSLCVYISLSGTVALVCFFAPKVYIIIWQPDKNVRIHNKAVSKLVNQQLGFIRTLTVNHGQKLNVSMKVSVGNHSSNTCTLTVSNQELCKKSKNSSTVEGPAGTERIQSHQESETASSTSFEVPSKRTTARDLDIPINNQLDTLGDALSKIFMSDRATDL